jgi:hypothetical protein
VQSPTDLEAHELGFFNRKDRANKIIIGFLNWRFRERVATICRLQALSRDLAKEKAMPA